ncbi:MAG TPA: hypothetical protein VFD38_09145 [Myxococcaceae bacterium]|nr:hypothetical protein [Myxococcaceae bacterium]
MTARIAAAALAALLAAGCNEGGPFNPDAGFPAFDVTIGGVRLVANSSAAIANGNVFTVLLSDQPNACQQYGHYPTRTWTTLTLVLATGTTSPTVGTVVPQQGVPGPGQVVGALIQATADLPPTANLDAIDGTVTWKSNTDFSVTLQSMDVGFEGTADRLRVQSIGVPPCTPQ